MAMILAVFSGKAKSVFKPGLVAAQGGHVSPVNSSNKDILGVWALIINEADKKPRSKFFFMCDELADYQM
jgi:hypothetical protein